MKKVIILLLLTLSTTLLYADSGDLIVDGKLGLGTPSPSNKLQIGPGLSGWNGNDFVVSNTNGALAINNNSGSAYIFGSQRLDFMSNSTFTMSLLNGNVGVGTQHPDYKLMVYGQALGNNAGDTSRLFSLQNAEGSWNQLNFLEIRHTSGGDWYGATTRIQKVIDSTPMGYIDFNPPGGSYSLALGSGSSEIVRIANSGNVGIGTSNPTQKLEVNGKIKITDGSQGAGKVLTSDANGAGTWQNAYVPGGLYGWCRTDASSQSCTSNDVVAPATCSGSCGCPAGFTLRKTGRGESYDPTNVYNQNWEYFYTCVKN